jgi:cyclophilin family peptidyl-prolyl cis-trans isomerase
MANRTAEFVTNNGTFSVEIFEDKVPVTAGNFINLSERGFYDGVVFHRVIERAGIGGPNTQTGTL